VNFADRLCAAVDRCGTPAVLGLDPRPEHLPAPWRRRPGEAGAGEIAECIRAWQMRLLELAAPRLPMVKPQAAFYERWGPPGMEALAEACARARELGMLVLLDGKRGDIGSTAAAYADAWLRGDGFPAADALTVNPYLGEDACRPFLDRARECGAGLFFLVKTSNPGAGLFQDHGEPPLAEAVACAVHRWGEELQGESGWSGAGAVIGATRPGELARFRELLPRALLLLPGFGFQGGTAEGLAPAFDARGHGAVVPASRSLLHAHEREDLAGRGWEEAFLAAVEEMVAALRTVCPLPSS